MEGYPGSNEVIGLCYRSACLQAIVRDDGPTLCYSAHIMIDRPAFVALPSSSVSENLCCRAALPICATSTASVVALSTGWALLDRVSGMLLFVDECGSCRPIADFCRGDVLSLCGDSTGSLWATRADGSVHTLAFDRSRGCWRRDVDAFVGCALRSACVLTIAESAALLPPALFGEECGAPHRSAAAGLSIALSDTMADVAALLEGMPIRSTRACDGYLRRFVATHSDGSVSAYTVPTADAAELVSASAAADAASKAAASGKSSSGLSSSAPSFASAVTVDSAAATAALRQTTAVVASGLLTAVRTLRDTKGGQAVQSYLGPASRWVPHWVAQSVRDAAAGRILGAGSGASASAAEPAKPASDDLGNRPLESHRSAAFTGTTSGGSIQFGASGAASDAGATFVSSTLDASAAVSPEPDAAAAGAIAASTSAPSRQSIPAAGKTVAAIPQATVPLDSPEQLIAIPPLPTGATDRTAAAASAAPRIVHCTKDFTVSDTAKRFTSVVPGPHSHLLLASDTSGRVLLLDGSDLAILRMWKGYRDAQVAWVLVRSPGGEADLTQTYGAGAGAGSGAGVGAAAVSVPPEAAESSLPAAAASSAAARANLQYTTRSQLAQGSATETLGKTPLVVIFAPRRACIEVWWPHGEMAARVQMKPEIASLAGIRLLPVLRTAQASSSIKSPALVAEAGTEAGHSSAMHRPRPNSPLPEIPAPALPSGSVALALPAGVRADAPDLPAEGAGYGTGTPGHVLAATLETMRPFVALTLPHSPPLQLLLLNVEDLASMGAAGTVPA